MVFTNEQFNARCREEMEIGWNHSEALIDEEGDRVYHVPWVSFLTHCVTHRRLSPSGHLVHSNSFFHTRQYVL